MDTSKETAEAGTENITDINGKLTDEETEIDENNGDDDAWKDTFDAVVVEAEAGKLGVDNDEEEDNEDNED